MVYPTIKPKQHFIFVNYGMKLITVH